MRIEIANLIKKYDGGVVLDMETLCFEEGMIHVLIGPNGSGKSTLLNIVAGLEPFDSGRLTYGADRRSFDEVKSQATLVMQHPYLFNATVYSNIGIGLRYRGLARGAIRKRVLESAERVNLSRFLFRNTRTLSGGERQRVALARALVLQPRLLLLDESTANLDPESIGIIEKVLEDFQRETGGTIIFVTHNIVQARRLGHRIILLMDGKPVEQGEKDKFFQRPDSDLTKRFIRGQIIY